MDKGATKEPVTSEDPVSGQRASGTAEEASVSELVS